MNERNKSFYPSNMFEFIHHPKYGCRDLKGLTWHNFLLFSKKIFEEVFVLLALPSNEKDSSNHHNSYNKGPNLAFFSFTKSPTNSLLTIKFPKNHITSSYYSNILKTTMAKIWLLKNFIL
jgi:hypothetical protein